MAVSVGHRSQHSCRSVREIFVCSDHFLLEDYGKPRRGMPGVYLSNTAIPSVNITEKADVVSHYCVFHSQISLLQLYVESLLSSWLFSSLSLSSHTLFFQNLQLFFCVFWLKKYRCGSWLVKKLSSLSITQSAMITLRFFTSFVDGSICSKCALLKSRAAVSGV